MLLAIWHPDVTVVERNSIAARSRNLTCGGRGTLDGRGQVGFTETVAFLIAGFIGADDLATMALVTLGVAISCIGTVVAKKNPRPNRYICHIMTSCDRGSCGGISRGKVEIALLRFNEGAAAQTLEGSEHRFGGLGDTH